MKVYPYVGPDDIRQRSLDSPGGTPITTVAELLNWLQTHPDFKSQQTVTVTFVIDAEGSLRIADRRSEHVACAQGGPVRNDVLNRSRAAFCF